MKEIARFVKKLRGVNHVERWNFHPHLRRENVAEHSMWVAVFAAILADPIDRNALVFAAVMHDAEEAITADLPALVKAKTPQWSAVVDVAEAELFQAAIGKEEREIQDAFCAARRHSESPVVKLADLFSALMYARMEIELGNTHFLRIENELIGSICKAIAKVDANSAVSTRAVALLDALGFDHMEAIDRPSEISHL